MIAAAVLSLQYPSAVKADAASEIAAIKAAMDSLGQAFLAEDGTGDQIPDDAGSYCDRPGLRRPGFDR